MAGEQEALAELLGVERSTVMRWEHGDTEPLPSMRPRLAKALRISAGRLQELLSSDGGRGTGAEPGTVGDRAPAVPRQLPAAVADFTGRAAELRALTSVVKAVLALHYMANDPFAAVRAA